MELVSSSGRGASQRLDILSGYGSEESEVEEVRIATARALSLQAVGLS
jgi:hypothetical protein